MRAVSHTTRVAFAAAVAAGLGVVVATVWVGSLVKEETVVANPYDDGLRYDAERGARAALGWDVRALVPPPAPGPAALEFQIVDAAGLPVEGAAVAVLVSRPDTSRDAATFAARGEDPGRYVAELVVPAAGPWRLTFDVRRGEDRVRIEKLVSVAPPCDAGAGPCTRPLPGGGEVTLELGPRPLRTMQELEVRVAVRLPSHPDPLPRSAGEKEDRVTVSFEMPGMDMGENRVELALSGPGRFAGKAVLVRCPSGRIDWVAAVEVSVPGSSPSVARFDLTVER
jgi:nitrogen fixation protein FixH